MAPLNKVTYNVRGLHSPNKRHQISRELKAFSANIVFLQETHLKWSSKINLGSKIFPTWFHGFSSNKRSKGMAIGFDRNTLFKLKAIESDPEGQFLFIKGSLFNIICTLVNVYCPNTRSALFLKKVMNKLEAFRKGRLIIVGDFNFVFDPALETQPLSLRSEGKYLRAIKQKLHKQQLVEAWRILHPRGRDFTYYSLVHSSYSRIDYILLDHQLLEGLVKAEIKSITLSDHVSVVVALDLKDLPTRQKSWRLDESLLHNSRLVTDLESDLLYTPLDLSNGEL